MLGSIIKLLVQSTEQGRPHTEMQLAPLFKWKEESCELHDSVFETETAWNCVNRAPPPYQIDSSPPR
jgi:hypothetical protein